MDTATQIIADKLQELLSQDKRIDYSINNPSNPTKHTYVPVKHNIEHWLRLINMINNGKFKINKPKVSRMCKYSYCYHLIKDHYIFQTATLSYKGKKINLRHFKDLDFGSGDDWRSTPYIADAIHCYHIEEESVRYNVFDYVHQCCEPNITYFINQYKEAWQNTVNNADQIISAYFNTVGDERRTKLREELSKFLKNSNFLEMDTDSVLTLLGFKYNELKEFADFVHKYRQFSVIATSEDVETAKELAKVMQVQDV